MTDAVFGPFSRAGTHASRIKVTSQGSLNSGTARPAADKTDGDEETGLKAKADPQAALAQAASGQDGQIDVTYLLTLTALTQTGAFRPYVA